MSADRIEGKSDKSEPESWEDAEMVIRGKPSFLCSVKNPQVSKEDNKRWLGFIRFDGEDTLDSIWLRIPIEHLPGDVLWPMAKINLNRFSFPTDTVSEFDELGLRWGVDSSKFIRTRVAKNKELFVKGVEKDLCLGIWGSIPDIDNFSELPNNEKVRIFSRELTRRSGLIIAPVLHAHANIENDSR